MIFKNSMLFLIVLSAVALIFLGALIYGVYNIRKVNTETSVLLNSADSSAEVATLARSVRTIQKESALDIRAFDDLVMSSGKLIFLIENIERVGRALGLGTDILSVGEAEEGATAGSRIIRIVMETQGDWSGTLAFLKAIESLPYRTMIEESSFSKEETSWRSKIVLLLHSFN